MKVLLAINEFTDLQGVTRYCAKRFADRDTEIDVLTVLPHGTTGGGAGAGRNNVAELPNHGHRFDRADALVAALVTELQEQQGFAVVCGHVSFGDPVEAILSARERFRSSQILIEAPRRQGLLTAFRLDGVTRRLLGKAECPVELVRTEKHTGDQSMKVLVSVGLDQLDNFPFERLAALSLAPGSQLSLVGVMPPAMPENSLEIGAAVAVRALQMASHRRILAEARLEKVRKALFEEMSEGVGVDCEVLEGSTREVTVDAARRAQASLLVIASAASDGALRGLFSTLSPAAIAMSAACSVLLLRAPQAATTGCEEDDGVRFASFSN